MITIDVLSDAQAKQVIDSEQAFAAWSDAWQHAREYAGGMHWKTVAGREYLYKTQDRKGNAKSLGARSAQTELVYAQFHAGKKQAQQRESTLSESLKTHAKINAVLRVGSAPPLVAQICLQLSKAQLLGRSLMVIGTNSLYAYESMAGMRFSAAIKATTDIDLLWNHKAKLSLSVLDKDDASAAPSSDGISAGLLGVLQKADKSFQRLQLQHFRAANDQGYLVDLIRQMPKPAWKPEPDTIGGEHDLIATDIWNMRWLLNAPRVEQLAIATNGVVFPITAPDPRAYCAFKYWLSQSDERNPQKKSRDFSQAQAVYQLIEDRLPHLANHWEDISSIPKAVLRKIKSGALAG